MFNVPTLNGSEVNAKAQSTQREPAGNLRPVGHGSVGEGK